MTGGNWRLVATAFTGVALIGPQGVAAQEWDITPAITVEEIYTDNVDQVETGEESDFITVVQPSVVAHRRGPRLTADLAYAPEYIKFIERSEQDEFRNNFLGRATATVVDERFFVDARAAVTQELISGANAISGTGVSDQRNRTETYTAMVSPYVVGHFGPWADGRLAYRLSWNSDGEDVLGESVRQAIIGTLDSGRRFSVLQWGLLGSVERVDRDDGTETGLEDDRTENRYRALATPRYLFSPRFAVFATLGYEKVEDDEFGDVSGPTARLGFDYKPNRRLQAVVSYGRELEEESAEALIAYRPSTRTAFTLLYDESIQTSDRLRDLALEDVTVDEEGEFIDETTRTRPNFSHSAFDLTNEPFRQRRLTISASTRRGRNSFFLSIYREEREVLDTDEERSSYGGSVTASRRLSKPTTGFATLLYRHTDFEETEFQARDDDLVVARAGLAHTIYENVTGSLSYVRTMRSSSGPGADFVENAVILSVRATF